MMAETERVTELVKRDVLIAVPRRRNPTRCRALKIPVRRIVAPVPEQHLAPGFTPAATRNWIVSVVSAASSRERIAPSRPRPGGEMRAVAASGRSRASKPDSPRREKAFSRPRWRSAVRVRNPSTGLDVAADLSMPGGAPEVAAAGAVWLLAGTFSSSAPRPAMPRRREFASGTPLEVVSTRSRGSCFVTLT